jgi:hypothetical protein
MEAKQAAKQARPPPFAFGTHTAATAAKAGALSFCFSIREAMILVLRSQNVAFYLSSVVRT